MAQIVLRNEETPNDLPKKRKANMVSAISGPDTYHAHGFSRMLDRSIAIKIVAFVLTLQKHSVQAERLNEVQSYGIPQIRSSAPQFCFDGVESIRLFLDFLRCVKQRL